MKVKIPYSLFQKLSPFDQDIIFHNNRTLVVKRNYFEIYSSHPLMPLKSVIYKCNFQFYKLHARLILWNT